MKKWFPYILIVVIAVAVFLVRNYGKDSTKPAARDTKEKTHDPRTKPVNRERGFDRRVSFLEYSKHAKCRMQCREITGSEVEDIMKEGKINYDKSDLKNAKCPRYAIEGRTSDNQRVRIVFAQCNESTVVVTVIDLDHEYSCNCPGDDNKFKTRN